jgi:hypothetical protein
LGNPDFTAELAGRNPDITSEQAWQNPDLTPLHSGSNEIQTHMGDAMPNSFFKLSAKPCT